MPLRPVRACALPFGGHRRVGGHVHLVSGRPLELHAGIRQREPLRLDSLLRRDGELVSFQHVALRGRGRRGDQPASRRRFLPDGLVQRRGLHGEPARRPHSAFGKRRELRVRGAGAACKHVRVHAHRLSGASRHRVLGRRLRTHVLGLPLDAARLGPAVPEHVCLLPAAARGGAVRGDPAHGGFAPRAHLRGSAVRHRRHRLGARAAERRVRRGRVAHSLLHLSGGNRGRPSPSRRRGEMVAAHPARRCRGHPYLRHLVGGVPPALPERSGGALMGCRAVPARGGAPYAYARVHGRRRAARAHGVRVRGHVLDA